MGALTRLAWLAFRERIYRAAQDAGYTDLQPTHLSLFRYPTIAGMRPGELADQVGISKQAINDQLRQLEARNYLTLQSDPSDGRARLIALTDRGSEVMEFCRAASQQIAREWAQRVGVKRFEAFQDTLLRLLEAEGKRPAGL